MGPDSVYVLIPIVGVLATFIGLPLAIGYARRLWRDADAPRAAALPSDVAARLERMEQAIEAVATEVERIAEGQRFTTRLLTESRPREALPAPGGAAATGATRHD